jgi:hypothetical protein
MTEAEWLACDDHMLMTYFVADRMSLRKLRLAEVAICRRVERDLVDERSRHALEVSEAYADGLVSDEVLAAARSHAKAVYQSLRPHATGREPPFMAILSLCGAVGTEPDLRMQADMIDIALFAPRPRPDSIPSELRAASAAEAELVRDVFGNPFRQVSFSPSWRTGTAVSLAQQMYDAREFSGMPILADALQDAGCDSDDVLFHCRDTTATHVRGCWVCDLLLGRG